MAGLAGFHLREANAGDVPALAALKRATFRETFLEDFAIPYPPADIAVFEEESYAPARVSAELADPTHKSWVVEVDGALAGYAHCGPCKLPHPEVTADAQELYQLYVRRAAQGAGLGKALLASAMAHMQARIQGGRAPVWLGVWSGNIRAQAVYTRLGFELVGAYRFRVGGWYDDELIMRREAGA